MSSLPAFTVTAFQLVHPRCRRSVSQLAQGLSLTQAGHSSASLLSIARSSKPYNAQHSQQHGRLSTISATPAPVALAGSLLNPMRRRALFRGAVKGIIGLLVSTGMVMDFPLAALARAKTSEAEQILKDVDWPAEWPFVPEHFSRYDESPDTSFYSAPRFVTHIDDSAIRALTKYYDSVFPPSNTPGIAILDMCSSWISHYPKDYKQEKIVGLGLNEAELKENKVLTSYTVQDLNVDPKLPFEDNSFDIITNVVSVDYLNKPLEIFKEMHRVLKPGGLAAMSFSNRCFWTKAIQIWTGTGDVDHCYIVGAYFHYAGGFEAPQALDISPNPGRSDPLYVVFSRKLQA